MKDYSFGVIPIKKDDRGERLYLLVQLAKAGCWDFPRGHKEEGEDDRDAARRELQEETGLEVVEWLKVDPQIIKYIGEKDGEKVDKTVTFYPATVKGDLKLASREISDARWLPYQEARKRLTYDNTRKILDQVESEL